MNDDKLFIIAIGGTGMRCLEAFVHLCAIGMFDNKEIEILTLDTDQANGNKGRVEQLIELYNRVKTNDETNKGGSPNANTFFSAKLNMYRFFTDYSRNDRKTFTALSQVTNLAPELSEDNKDITDLLLDEDVQEFNLEHGYRAQTHLGSMLMYHGIIEAAIRAKRGGKDVKAQELALKEFIELIHKNSSKARIFIFGSVFGGTGASSIPVVPIALKEAVSILMNGSDLKLSNVKFGSTLLTDYFTFNPPTDTQKNTEHVVAASSNFALNSQAALQFYIEDPTVSTFYKRLYHIGCPVSLKSDYSRDNKAGQTVTGGADQKNPCHLVELMCACAAYDFFTGDINEKQANYLYRNVEVDNAGELRLTGKNFCNDGDKFENKLGSFLSLAHLMLSKHAAAFGAEGTYSFLDRFHAQKIHDYDDITPEQAKEIDNYLKMFAYDIEKGELVKGWIYQVAESVGSGSFIFVPNAFETSVSALSSKKYDPGWIFRDDAHNWAKSWPNSRYDVFVSKGLKNDCFPYEDQNVKTTKEMFLAHMYNAITKAQHFN